MPKHKYDVFGPLPYDPELTRHYDLVEATSPLNALVMVHRDALGSERVKLRAGQIVFTHAEDLWMAVGRWRITRAGWNGEGAIDELLILPPDRAEGISVTSR